MAERPKRRKHKDNPYTLEVCEERNIYKVYFKDGKGVNQCVEISEDVFKALDRFELDDLSELNEYDNHIEHSEVYEHTLNKRAVNKQRAVDDEVEMNVLTELMKEAINELPDVQRRRLKMYYFENMSFEQIARAEKCTKMAVKFSVDIAIEKISKKLKV